MLDNNLTRKASASDALTIVRVKVLVASTVNITIAILLGAEIPAVGTTALPHWWNFWPMA